MIKSAVPIIAVSDSRRAEAYYCGLLGFRLKAAYRPDPNKSDPCYLCVARDDVELHVQSFKRDRAGLTDAYLWVSNVDELYAEFSGKGVTCQPPVNQTWGTREMGVRDPDGNVLNFGVPLSKNA
jgi:catechol 2,3-dioxygenase-like lactoylglutathione lyase family enzyme